MTNFQVWEQHNLARFAREANEKLLAQQKEIEQLREDLRVAIERAVMSGDHSMNQTSPGWRKRQIAFLEALAQPEQKEKFCDSNCVWTDHHPDCNLAQSEQDTICRLSALVRAQQITIDKLEAQPEQKPVAYFNPQVKGGFYWAKPTKITAPMTVSVEPMPLYTSPPPHRTWVGLTDEENLICLGFSKVLGLQYQEAKLKEKNT